MHLSYIPNIPDNCNDIVLDKEESRHIVKVLRMGIDNSFKITDGNGMLLTVKIVDADPKRCRVEIVDREKATPLPYQLHLAVAPTKMNERYEWFLEKTTEIGITEITPIICEHSERKSIKAERYEKIIQSAMKQSLKFYLPALNPSISLKEFLNASHSENSQKFIAHCEDSEKVSLKQSLAPKKDVVILIGPEGDFTKDEISLAIQKGYKPVSLGNSRLRTETAAVVACHSVAFVNEEQ